MYHYIYDSFLSEKKYQTTVAKIETRLTDLGINGKISRLSFLKNIEGVLEEEIERGLKTIVIIGNDKTIGQMLNIIRRWPVTIGIIPVGEMNNIAKMLGIPENEKACDVLSSRITDKLDLVKINSYYFLTSAIIEGSNISLECDDNYFINLDGKDNVVSISNLDYISDTACCNPNDGKLDLIIKHVEKNGWLFKKKTEYFSNFSAKRIRVSSVKTLPILLMDERKIIKTPAEIEIEPEKLTIIVGKNRQY